MIFALFLEWIFGLLYIACCIGCISEGARAIIQGHITKDKIVGLLTLLLGILGLYIIF